MVCFKMYLMRFMLQEEKRYMMKKNNTGFSLVELIVVVLIMAIIAVALAPQVMKWVHNSRMATDVQTRNSLKRQCQLALTDVAAFNKVKDGGYVITFTKSLSGTTSCMYSDYNGVDITPDPNTDAYWNSLLKVTGDTNYSEFENRFQIKSIPEDEDIVLKVKVYENGYTVACLTGIADNEDIEVVSDNDDVDD